MQTESGSKPSFLGFFARHKIFGAILVVLVVVVVFIVRAISNISGLVSASRPRTVTLHRTGLEQKVTASGIVASQSITTVSAKTSAQVKAVYVKVGDQVKEGQVLALLDGAAIDRQIDNLNASYSDAKKARDLQISEAQKKVNAAEDALKAARTALDSAVSLAKGALDRAMAIEDTRAEWMADDATRAEFNAMDSAKSSMDVAKVLMDGAKAALDGDPGNTVLQDAYDAAKGSYESAKAIYEAAKAVYEAAWTAAYFRAYTPSNFAAEQKAYETALADRASKLRDLESAVDTTKSALATLNANDSTKSIQRSINDLKEQREDLSIKATATGTVTTVNATQGVYATGPMFVIMDLGSLEVSAEVAEFDVVLVSKGMAVTVTSDALPGKTWRGEVSRIAPVGSIAGTFTVTVRIVNDVGDLRGGMSAKLSIVTDSRSNVWAVPYDCVVKDEAGMDVVYVLEPLPEGAKAGTPRNQVKIAVSMGLETDYYVEIVSSQLSDGMEILNDPLNANTTNNVRRLFGN